MLVEMTFVTICSHFHATGICPAIQTLVEGHDVRILLSQLHHAVSHREIVVISLELNPVVTTPWMDLVDILITPDILRFQTLRGVVLSVHANATSKG